MKHLFIINPASGRIKGKVKLIIDDIEKFFKSNPQLEYSIHITRWSRDAVGFVRRYVENKSELVRVYAVGGTGTLFEVVNGVVGLANVQVALYPYGSSNAFLRYFGGNKSHLFSSLRNLVFSKTTAIDAIRCGHNYGLCACAIGLEAISNNKTNLLKDRVTLPTDIISVGSAIFHMLKNKHLANEYKIKLDRKVLDGEYITLLISNQPCYGEYMNPAVEAHPNDGILDLYLFKNMSKARFSRIMPAYISGNYSKHSKYITHHTGQTVLISADDVMCITLDGEVFYEATVECEVIPYAVDFVCPDGIDIKKIPRIYNKPEEGYVGE